MAEATALGIFSANRPKAGTRPSTMASTAATTKTPTATGQEIPEVVPASRAAPGVDQARTTGILRPSDIAPPARPIPRHRAVTADPVCSGLAPRTRMACTTSATVPPNPIRVAIRAADQAVTGGVLKVMGLVA